MVLQAWNALRWSRHRRQSNGGAVLREARADGSPPVPEPYASMSVEDKIDFIAQNILRNTIPDDVKAS